MTKESPAAWPDFPADKLFNSFDNPRGDESDEPGEIFSDRRNESPEKIALMINLDMSEPLPPDLRARIVAAARRFVAAGPAAPPAEN